MGKPPKTDKAVPETPAFSHAGGRFQEVAEAEQVEKRDS